MPVTGLQRPDKKHHCFSTKKPASAGFLTSTGIEQALKVPQAQEINGYLAIFSIAP
jgi:hypothetical protein